MTREFWISRRGLKHRLRALFPSLRDRDFTVATTEHRFNAPNSNFVRHHAIACADGAAVECFEKSVSRLSWQGTLESRFYDHLPWLGLAGILKHPECIGVIDTPLASFIYTQAIHGQHPDLGLIAADMAQGIAEIERESRAHLRSPRAPKLTADGRMDFFRPWHLHRARYNYARALQRFARLRHASIGEAERSQLLELGPRLVAMGRQAKGDSFCFSHLDYLKKNIVANANGLHLIDWGELKVGRLGFDAGAYLHGILRSAELPVFERACEAFFDAYFACAEKDVSRSTIYRNAHYILALRSLCYFLRIDRMQRSDAEFAPDFEKLTYVAKALRRLPA